MQTKILTTLPQMLQTFETIKFLYPNMEIEKYEAYLTEMIPKNYQQIALFDQNVCAGLTGLWTGVKLWTGKYLEIDNFIVHPDYRKNGIGKTICEAIDEIAKQQNCTCVVLDAFTTNFVAHKFYYNLGYEPKGFHFIKTINANGFS